MHLNILKYCPCGKSQEEAEWDNKIKRPRCLPLFNNPRKLIYGFQVIIIVGVLHAIFVGFIGGTYGAFDGLQIAGYAFSFIAAVILATVSVFGIITLMNWVIEKQTFIIFNVFAFASLILGLCAIVPFVLPTNLYNSEKYMRAYFNDNEDMPLSWRILQQEHKCCGLSSWKDYQYEKVVANGTFRLPASCCKNSRCHSDEESGKKFTLDEVFDLFYTKGCYKPKNYFLVKGTSAENLYILFIIVLGIFPIYPSCIICVFIYYWIRIKCFHDVDPEYVRALDTNTFNVETEESVSLKDFFGVYAPSSGRKVTLDRYPVPWENERENEDYTQSLPELQVVKIQGDPDESAKSKIASVRSRRELERKEPPPGGLFGPSHREAKAIALKRRIWQQMSKFRVRKNEFTQYDLDTGLISESQISVSGNSEMMISDVGAPVGSFHSFSSASASSVVRSNQSQGSLTSMPDGGNIPSTSKELSTAIPSSNKKTLPVVIEHAPVKRHEKPHPDTFWQI